MVYVMYIDPREGHLAQEALQSAILQSVANPLVTTTVTAGNGLGGCPTDGVGGD